MTQNMLAQVPVLMCVPNLSKSPVLGVVIVHPVQMAHLKCPALNTTMPATGLEGDRQQAILRAPTPVRVGERPFAASG